MKQLITAMLLLLCNSVGAQSNVPLAIEDPKMDAYLRTRKPPTLTIQIKNLPDSVEEMEIKYTLVCFGADFQIKKYTKTDKRGFVKIALDQNFPYQQIWLSIGDLLYTGAYVNTDLKVTIDAGEIKSKDGIFLYGDGVTYSGTDGELNTVICKHTLYKRAEQNELGNRFRALCQSRRNISADLFQQKTDSIYKAIVQINDEFIKEYPDYNWAIKNETESEYYGQLCTTYYGDTMPANLFSRVNTHKPYFTSNEGVLFYRYLTNYNKFKPQNSIIAIDPQFLMRNYAHYDAERKSVIDSLKYYEDLSQKEKEKQFAKISSLEQKCFQLFPQEINAMQMSNTIKIFDRSFPQSKSDLLKTFFLEDGKDEFSIVYPEIISHIKTTWCERLAKSEFIEASVKQKSIDSLLASSIRLVASDYFIGKPLETLPFEASLYQLDSINNVKDFIINLKSKFKNKALVIDFWATWCVPCLNDLPFSKKLHEANKDLPMEYVYICTSSVSNTNLWKNKVAGLQLAGTHIFMNEKIVSELKSSFNRAGSGFPTYVAIDINGNLRANAIQWVQSLDREKLKELLGIK
ncbi:redoxin family protein [Rhizosphaericola mali]|uniref:Redoxin family protein n=1 Tax=Rhizosphaericola mali TaxID=2545455 RepID=A0A5P2GFC0_9BACT|nr:redoxin family protein [Rhizosphaericola mali]QES90311.1 redoxin family protein [Rhizosphaericola mali]